MTILFKDDFSGTGPLNGTAPTAGGFGQTWSADADLSLVGGSVYNDQPSSSSDYLAFTATIAGLTPAPTENIECNFSFTTDASGGMSSGSRLSIGTVTALVFDMRLVLDDLSTKYFMVRLWSQYGNPWELRVDSDGGSGDYIADVDGVMGANTTFPGQLAINVAAKTYSLSFMGATLNGLLNYYGGQEVLNHTGFEFTLWKQNRLDSIEVTDAAGVIPGQMIAPLPVVTGFGFPGYGTYLSCPTPRLSASGHNSAGENAFAYTLPMPLIVIAGGGNASFAMPRAAIGMTATFMGSGRADLTMPRATMQGSGTVSGTGSFSPNISMPMAEVVGYSGAVASISLTGEFNVAAGGKSGGVGSAFLVLPLFELSASGSSENRGSADLFMPSARLGATAQAWIIMPQAQLTAIGSATVSVTYEAYSVNLGHRDPESNNEVTRYTNYPFDRIVRYKNSYFGMNSTGLYLLDSGALDNGAAIPYEMQTHETDFGVPEQKTVVSAYFGGKLGPAEKVTLFVGEKSTKPYSYTTPRGAKPQTYRQVFGKGIKDRYYAIGVSGNKEFELDTVDFEVAKLKRRI